jgi:uncharacterized membrane protein YbhN (UPF0104 family)
VDRAPSNVKQKLRQLAPWLVGLAILVVVITRVPFDAFGDAIEHGPHLQLAIVDLLICLSVLCTDSVATWLGLIAVRLRRPFATVMSVRGATYALFVINYAVGQGAFGYYLAKTGVKPLRATGATLFLIGTNLATMLVLVSLTWALGDLAVPSARLTWTLAIGCSAFAVYLAVIAVSPRFIARRELFAPLFEAGLRGHLVAMLGRVPHVTVVVLAQWVALRAWGIPVPLYVGVLIMPIVVIATVLPISPAGLGTAQAAFVYFFQGFAQGATADERTAKLVAFGIVHFVYGVMASLLVGLVCLPIAKRRGALREGA